MKTTKLILGDVFGGVKKHLDTLDTINEKIAYVIQRRTWYLQADNEILTDDNSELPFDKKCDLELEMLRELKVLELEKQRLERTLPLEERQAQSKDGIKKHKDLNQRTATLFLSYLLDFANEKKRENFGLKNKKSLADADKDRIIDFLTPISGKQSKKLHKVFRDEIAKIAEKQENSKEFYDDMQIVRKYFEMLGLSEITNRIDADLGEK